MIDIPIGPKSGTLEGFAEFKINYGRAGAPLKHELIIKKQVVLAFNAAGQFEHGSWADAK